MDPTETTGPGPEPDVILLVEDEDAVRGLAREVLEESGFRVLEAHDGDEALAIVARETVIDLMVTDVIMPRMNGRELADRVRLVRPDLAVVFTSGYPGDSLLERRRGEDPVIFMAKPYSPFDLAERVRQVLDSRRGSAPGGEDRSAA